MELRTPQGIGRPGIEAARDPTERKKGDAKTSHLVVPPKLKQFNFLNISDASILEYLTGQNPKWANLFPEVD